MGQLGTLAGMNGLAKGVDRVAESQRNLATLTQVEQGVQKEKAESILLQQMEAKQYEEIQAKASELLEKDRDKIRTKSLALQMNIRSKVEEYGSRKAFFAAGGSALLSQYKNDLLTSAEFLDYKDNKANMTNILRVQEAGKTLNKVDEQNLINYNLGLSNKVTYTGIKNDDIKIPSNEYDYGTVIPPQVILHADGNYMKIYSNFLLDHPEEGKQLKGQDLEDRLQEYTLREHGGNKGTDHTREKEALAASARRAAQIRESAVNGKVGPHGVVPTYVNALNMLKENKDVPLTLDNLYSKDYFDRVNKSTNNTYAPTFGGDQYKDAARKNKHKWTEAPSKAFDRIGESLSGLFNEETNLRVVQARPAFTSNRKEITNAIYDAGENGTVIIQPNTTDYYQATGDKLEKSNLAYDATSATVQSYIFAPYDTGTGKMIMEPVDHNGKRFSYSDKSTQQILADQKKLYTGNPEYSMFAVLKTPDGETIYQKHDINKWETNAKFATALGAGNDLNPIYEQNKELDKVMGKTKQEEKNNEIMINNEVQKARSEKGVFSMPEAVQESSSLMYNGENRTDLYQAYNVAMAMLEPPQKGVTFQDNLAYGVKNREFTSKYIDNYPKLKSAITNKKAYSDIKFMDIFAEEVSENDPEHLAENQEFSKLWKQVYQVITKKS